MKTKDYQTAALKYALPYLRTNKDIALILKAAGERFNNLQLSISYLLNSLNIQDARGIWLTNIGSEVGASRDETDYGNYFCVNCLHLNVKKDFYFLTSGVSPLKPLSLKDAEFIQKIMAYIYTNNSASTWDEIIKIVQIITNAESVSLDSDANDGVTISLNGKNLVVTQNTINYIKNVVANGVYIKEIKINDKTN